MSAILELKATPELCFECPIIYSVVLHNDTNTNVADREKYTSSRHPDCPLKITEDNLRWILSSYDVSDYTTRSFIECPKCEVGYDYDCNDVSFFETFNFCPNCGVKLLPPEKV